MARIRGTNTGPEMAVRRALWAGGVRYLVHARQGSTRPDIVVRGRKVAVFIDGCFWHGCPEHYVRPRSREEFWTAKLRENVERDRRQTLELELDGWRVLRFWEHETLSGTADIVERFQRVLGGLPDQDPRWVVVAVEPLDHLGSQERRHLQALRDPLTTSTIERKRTTTKKVVHP